GNRDRDSLVPQTVEAVKPLDADYRRGADLEADVEVAAVPQVIAHFGVGRRVAASKDEVCPLFLSHCVSCHDRECTGNRERESQLLSHERSLSALSSEHRACQARADRARPQNGWYSVSCARIRRGGDPEAQSTKCGNPEVLRNGGG